MFSIGDKVQKITDGKVGTIKNIISGKYQVIFEDGSAPYLSEDILQPYQEILTPLDAFTKCKFSGITDYRRTLSFQRLSGELTNMFYSMNNSFTEYLPHQFLPVTKFLQSPEERILIADEVGLGKTVESMYIWKELEARRNARRLLVICPAALREKWKRDMENLFGINAEIVKADKLFDRFQLIEKNKNREQFAYICSMESIRAKNTDAIFTTVCKLNKAFEDFSANYSEYAFNLTIIDEAHYLRNRETANFKTGARLRDISESFVLLSATPIQTGSENLYSLLNLLSPERFDNEWTFNHMLQKDSIFIQLANCLQRPSSTPDDFEKTIIDNAENGNLKEDELIQEIVASKESIFSSNEARMSYATDLRNQVFYNNLFNRTRRRFVFENTAKRKPNAVQFSLSPNELDLYNQVTQLIRDMSTGRSEIVTFALIARQRQMASCLPAAFKDWLNKAQDNDSLSDNDFSDDLSEFDDADNSENETSTKNTFENLKPFYSKIKKEFSNINYQELKSHDSKYNEFLESIKTLLKQNPKEKIIVFSFFRGTNEYLEERLKEDNINAVAIKGGMGNLKDDLLDEFRQNDSINILISSEVGSEGLDLQFASVEYNYDLPWNPMRLEQRIGRIDRIGQKAEVLRIFNLCCQNTIEDKILERLYERVKIFENSIGDMEDIVGQPIQELAIEILNPELTDADRDEKANQKIQVLINKRIMNNRLEEESGVLEEYREMVLNSIEKAKENKRDIDSAEKIFVISDFFKNYYPGTAFFEDKNNSQHYLLTMSDEAVLAFREFRRTEHLEKFTRIDSSAHSEVYLSFAKESNQRKRRNIENVELDHPIFDWIRWTVKKNPIRANACSAISMKPSELVQTGSYIYYIQKWVKTGVEKSAELKYFVASVENRTILDENRSEKILNSAITEGSSLIDANIRLMDFEPYYNTAQELINHAWDKYEAFVENYKKKSNYLYKKQMEFINFTADKKIQTHQQTIENLESKNRGASVIPMYQKMIEKIGSERNLKLKSLEKEQYLEPELFEIALGVLIVE